MKEVEVKKSILAANEAAAVSLRERFAQHRILVVDLISSPGSGKTTLLEMTARRLGKSLRLAAVVGDIATELDARRLRDAGLPAHQISTGGSCHLDARMVDAALAHTPFPDIDMLFIENVGNLICPTAYDLGEDAKVVLVSTTEGEDKPFKYPAIFSRAALAVITKVDLLPHVTFDMEVARDEIRALNPSGCIFEVSIDGKGLDDWCRLLKNMWHAKHAVPASCGG